MHIGDFQCQAIEKSNQNHRNYSKESRKINISPVSNVTNPAKEAASFLSILYAHVSDLESGAYMHWYFEVQTERHREVYQGNSNK